jgi:hypothetical protein
MPLAHFPVTIFAIRALAVANGQLGVADGVNCPAMWAVKTIAMAEYTVNEADHSISEHIIGSSFPIWDNTNQKRFITITGDEMKYINPTPATGGGTGVVILKRAE